MKIITGSRQSGKTTELIRISSVTGYPIVTFNAKAAFNVKMQAEKMGVSIPEPLFMGEFGVSLPSKVLVDQIDYSRPINGDMEIIAATVDKENIIEL